MALKEKIIDVMCKTLTVSEDELEENVSLLESIGVDSTEIVELTLALEKAFDVKIGPGEIIKNSTPADIITLVNGK